VGWASRELVRFVPEAGNGDDLLHSAGELQSKALLWSILAVSLGGLAAALTSQYIFGMQPGPWCILQRLICVLLAIACAAGLANYCPNSSERRCTLKSRGMGDTVSIYSLGFPTFFTRF
jgi:disulfide bond formation protein DsbB